MPIFTLYFCLLLAAFPSLLAQDTEAAAELSSGPPAPDLRPGLGLDDFSTSEIQQQMEAVRQFSATPLLPRPPEKTGATGKGETGAEIRIETPEPPPPPTLEEARNQSAPPILPQKGTATRQTNISKTIPMGDPFQLSLHGLIWTYIPGLSEYPRPPEFDRVLGNLETTFVFRFSTAGRYSLTFSRQFPSTGNLEFYNAEIIVEGQPAESENIKEQKVKLAGSANKNMDELNINYRITSQVISDIRRMLENGELDAAYQTLNSWPKSERGDIYDAAARYFQDAGMNSQAIDMWQHNVHVNGELRTKAVANIARILARSDDSDKLLAWLPQFLELAKNQQNSPEQEDKLIHPEDFATIFKTLTKMNRDSANPVTIVPADSKNAESILDFYQTYVRLYPDRNTPEILYNMALFFEQPSKNQDIRRARKLYHNIQTNYPVDKYSQKASIRLHYLNRQFFWVR